MTIHLVFASERDKDSDSDGERRKKSNFAISQVTSFVFTDTIPYHFTPNPEDVTAVRWVSQANEQEKKMDGKENQHCRRCSWSLLYGSCKCITTCLIFLVKCLVHYQDAESAEASREANPKNTFFYIHLISLCVAYTNTTPCCSIHTIPFNAQSNFIPILEVSSLAIKFLFYSSMCKHDSRGWRWWRWRERIVNFFLCLWCLYVLPSFFFVFFSFSMRAHRRLPSVWCACESFFFCLVSLSQLLGTFPCYSCLAFRF